MNILVYDVAAEYAGALTILKTFYNEVISYKDKTHNWYFVVSTDELEDCGNVEIIRVPWVKKSWLHRWWYDKFYARKLVEQYNIDLVFSMQNMPIEGVKCRQIVYLHQSLQFSPVRFSFWKSSERTFWVRQNIIGNMMKRTLKGADLIIVQTQWMKEATKNWLGDFCKQIKVISPQIEIKTLYGRNVGREKNLFIYPAGDGIHKNHQLVITACEILQQRNITYRVLFTINHNDRRYARKLYSQVKRKGLNIEFVGMVNNDEIMKLYEKSTLVFPSYLETFGLPLLEAKMTNSTILCSDLPFAHEILDNYNNVKFFDFKDAKQLADYMEKCCYGLFENSEKENIEQIDFKESGENLIKSILEME
jgi:glycosyltransferase involved in cell wall biosynthesis